MWTILIVGTLLSYCAARPSIHYLKNDLSLENESEDKRSEALRRLLEVFGIEDLPHVQERRQPPQYMLDLYNTVADVNGVTKDPNLLEGNTVRSFFDKLRSEEITLLFNLSSVSKSEKVLTAELHLFKLRPQSSGTFNRHHFRQVNVYQVLDSNKRNSSARKLLSSRLVPIHSSGWEVFSISQAVRSWVTDDSTNLGLLVTVRTLAGSWTDSPLVRFASSRNHHLTKQPILVLFTDDGRRSTTLQHTLNEPTDSDGQFPAHMSMPALGPRIARSLDDELAHQPPCQRHPLYVDFEEIGWSSWIVSPRGYNAYHCRGFCPFPLGQNMRATNHATVQSIINALKLTQGVGMPCCVPDKLFSINLLYFDDDGNVVLKQYDDMVAGSCGCH